MSYEAMHKVRACGLTDRTLVDVLDSLAFFLNQESGLCFPSTDSIARVARLSPNIVRRAVKDLETAGYISTYQKPGGRRNFQLHLERLPDGDCSSQSAAEVKGVSHLEGVRELTGVSEVKGVSHLEGVRELTGVSEVKGVSEVTPLPCKKCDPSPVRSERGPLSEVTPEQGINKESNKEEEQGIGTGSVAPSPDHFPDATKKIEEPKPKRTTTDRGSRLTITELPDDWKAFAEQEEPDLDPKRLFENFKDYWNGLSGAKAIKKDWKGTWRNFVRSFHNAEDWKRRPMLKRAPTHSPSRPGQFVEKKQSERDYFDW